MNYKRKKILYTNTTTKIGGAENSLIMLVRHLDQSKYEPIVLLRAKGSLSEEFEKYGIQVIFSPTHRLKIHNPFPYFWSLLCFYNVLKKYKIDLVHANLDLCTQYAFLPAKLIGIPLVTHIRDFLNMGLFYKMLLFAPDVLIANSNAVLQRQELSNFRTDWSLPGVAGKG